MLRYKDFVPRELRQPSLFRDSEHETFDDAVHAANQWLNETRVRLIQIETVVLPNIWSPWEEGSSDPSIGAGGDSVSRWHQFIRVWYQENEA